MLQIDNLTKKMTFRTKMNKIKEMTNLVISAFQMHLYALGTQDSFMTNRISFKSYGLGVQQSPI